MVVIFAEAYICSLQHSHQCSKQLYRSTKHSKQFVQTVKDALVNRQVFITGTVSNWSIYVNGACMSLCNWSIYETVASPKLEHQELFFFLVFLTVCLAQASIQTSLQSPCPLFHLLPAYLFGQNQFCFHWWLT